MVLGWHLTTLWYENLSREGRIEQTTSTIVITIQLELGLTGYRR